MATQPHTQPVTQITTTRQTCRACGSKGIASVLDLGVQILPRFVTGGPDGLPRAPLELIRCANCGLLQLHHTVNPDLLYREFWYRSSINQTMREALEDVIHSALQYQTKGDWLDIGANDGYLLRQVPKAFRKVACEPAFNFLGELEEHCDEVISDYFTAKTVHGSFDVITSVAMFYDLDEPGPFLDHIRNSLTKNGVWINQLNDAPTMLRQHAFDSICHEHLCYYDVPTLNLLYQKHGLTIVRVTFNDVNGGSIRVVAKRTEDQPIAEDLSGLSGVTNQQASDFANWVRRWKAVMQDLLGSMSEKPWGYGASTKGAVLLQYLEAETAIGPIADRNSLKDGKRMVGIWPVVNENEFRRAKPRYALCLPWAFRDEFLEREEVTRARGTSLIFPIPTIEVCP